MLSRRNLQGLEISGQVSLNGVSLTELNAVSKLVGYIQQVELLPDTITVREHLTMRVTIKFER